MLINLFQTVRSSGVPCTFRELLDLFGALENHLVYSNLDDFYFLSRAILVKDEKHYDKFDRAFEIYFKGIEKLEDIFQAFIPEDWFRKAFGHGGQNPEGIRMGGAGKSNKAVKVWEQRNYSNLDDSLIIGTREMQMALRRLRKFARQGTDLELDMDDTIKSTAKNAGYLDIKMVPERLNNVKVIVLFDVGGSMVPYIINKYSNDYKVIIVGDATMAPYEITNPGGSIEHWNEEAGATWIKRLSSHFDNMAWLNPVPDDHWDYTSSVCIIRDLFENRMYPLTLKGIEDGMSELSK